jgi:predicted MFS family arabinose efflux permease
MTLADVFSTNYGFNIGAGGLAYLGLGVGFMAASLFGAKFGSEVYKRVSVAVTVISNLFLIFPSFPKRMEELESQRCAFRRYVLGP